MLLSHSRRGPGTLLSSDAWTAATDAAALGFWCSHAAGAHGYMGTDPSPQVKNTLQPPYQIAAQNSWVKGVGAYTGEIAPELLVDLGVG